MGGKGKGRKERGKKGGEGRVGNGREERALHTDSRRLGPHKT